MKQYYVSGRNYRLISFLIGLTLLLSLSMTGQAQVYYLTSSSNANVTADADALNRVGFDGSSPTVLAPSVTGSPFLMALDAANQRTFIYESLAANRSIKVVGFDGTLIRTLSVAGQQLTALEYDPASDYLYFLTTDNVAATQTSSDALNRIKADGTQGSPQTLISSLTTSPLLLALNLPNNEAYIYEGLAASRSIKTITLSGSSGSVTRTVAVGAQVTAIEYDQTNNFIYYLTSDASVNVSANDALNRFRPDGTSPSVVAASVTPSPLLMALDQGNNRAFIHEGLAVNRAIKAVRLTDGVVTQVTSLSLLCTALDVAPAPEVTTSSVTNIATTSATAGGTVVRSAAALTERGVFYSASNTLPTTSDSKTSNGSSIGAFTATLNGLTSGTTYSVRAYATSGAGTSYGSVETFTTLTITATPVLSTPANGSLLNTDQPAYTGTAPANSTVTIYVDGTSIGTTTATGGNFSLTQPTALNQGSHTVYATAQASGQAVSVSSNTNTFTLDTVRPTVTVTSTAGTTTSTSPIPFTVTFSERVTGFVTGDMSVTNGTISGFSGSGTTYTFGVVPTGNGAVTVTVFTNVAQDAASNGNTGPGQLSVTYQAVTAAPVVTTPANGSLLNSTLVIYRGTAPANSTVTLYVDGTSIGTTTAIGGSWTQSPSIFLNDGRHTVYATAQLPGGLVSANSNTNTFTLDTVTPTVSIVSSAGSSGATTGTSPIPVTVTFSENVTGFDASDVTVTNGTVSDFSGSGTTYTFTVTPTVGGVVTVDVSANVAQDAASNGNTAATPFSINYSQPVTATPVLSTPANGSLLNTDQPAYTGTAPANSTVTIYVDGTSIGTTTATGGNFSLTQPTALSQGSHTVYATAQASGQAVSANSNTSTFTVDTTVPTVSLTGPASTSVAQITLTATFSEPVTGLTLSDLSVNNGTVTNLSTSDNATFTLTVTATANGPVTVTLPANVAQDGAGNGNVAASPFTTQYASNQAPTAIALSGTSVPENQPGGTVVGTLSTTDADVPAQTFTYALVNGSGDADNGSFTLDGNSLRTAASFNFETRASYSIRVRTTDSGTPAQSYETTFTITVGNVNELTVRGVAQTNVSCFNGNNGSATVEASGEAGPYTYDWSPGAPTGDGTATIQGLTAGVYTVVVTAANSTTATTTVTIAQPAPLQVSIQTPNSVVCGGSIELTAITDSPNATFNWMGTTPTTGASVTATSTGVYSVTLTDNNGCQATASTSVTVNAAPSPTLVSSGELNCTISTVTLTAGGGTSYIFSAGASPIDGGAGNTATVTSPGIYSVTALSSGGCTSTASMTVEQSSTLEPPQLTASAPSTAGEPISVTAMGCGGTLTWLPQGGTGTAAGSIYTFTQPGNYTLAATCTAGTCTSPASSPLTLQIRPEGFAITGVGSANCQLLDAGRGQYEVRFTPQYAGVSGPVSFAVLNELSPTTALGPYTLRLYSDNPMITLVANQSGSPEARFTYNWLASCSATTQPNRPPVARQIPDQQLPQGQTYSLELTDYITDPDGQPLTFSASGLPADLNLSGSRISGTAATTGVSTISLTALDPAGLQVTTSYQLTITPLISNPAGFTIVGVTTVSCQTLSVGQRQIRFLPQYGGLTGQPITFQVVNELSPTAQAGPYTLSLYTDNPVITLQAAQAGTAASATFRYRWLEGCGSTTPPANRAPVVGSGVANQTATVGQGYTLFIPSGTFTDPDGDVLTLSASGLPAGLAFSGNALTGTPATAGASTVTLTARDPAGLTASLTFTLTVVPATTNPPNADFAIIGVSTVQCEVLSAGQRRVSFTPLYSGVSGSPISFSVVNELVPTTAPGPYSLSLYTDNPIITLKALQGSSLASYSYNWLGACSASGRQGAPELSSPLRVTVLGNPVIGQQVDVEVEGAEGQSLRFTLTDQQGRNVSSRTVERAGAVERQTLPLNHPAGGLLLLRVSTPTQTQTVKLITGN